MLGYEWGSHSSPPPPPSQLIITDDINHHHHHHHHDPSSSSHRPIFHDPYSSPCTFPHDNNFPTPLDPHPTTLFHDPRAFPSASNYSPMLTSSFETTFQNQTGFLVPKVEPEYASRIGLNLGLGGRTYFSTGDDLVSRLYRRSRPTESLNSPKCQAEGCNADLTNAKHYHRRHKVCEFHSKAATVIAGGLTQRFCQQCSRFHQLSEFDNGKRSCRKRLADHNRRRRKSNQTNTHDHRTSSQSENAQNSPSQSVQRSPTDSGANSSSSVTVAISPPRASFDSNFRQRPLYE